MSHVLIFSSSLVIVFSPVVDVFGLMLSFMRGCFIFSAVHWFRAFHFQFNHIFNRGSTEPLFISVRVQTRIFRTGRLADHMSSRDTRRNKLQTLDCSNPGTNTVPSVTLHANCSNSFQTWQPNGFKCR